VITGHSFFARVIQITLPALFLSLISTVVSGQVLHDPFLQEFQVGAHSNPDKLEMVWGYPKGLLEPATVDTAWTNAGLRILNQDNSLADKFLTTRLLNAMNDVQGAADWSHWHRLRIEQLQPSVNPLDTTGRYLLSERLTVGFFHAVETRNFKEARKISDRLCSADPKLQLNSRETFVWKLRSRLLKRILEEKPDPNEVFWKSSLKLGSYDLGNAWALWTAHRRLNGYPALPQYLTTFSHARSLASLRKSWLSYDDISKSSFSHDTKAGLGSRLLKKQELNKHLASYPNPPSDFTLQGWWVSGQRMSRRGETGHYEKLGHRQDLKPGWRMDLFRRASEIHLLAGRWEKGLEDLKLALDLAGQDSGSKGQRRRLRQWTEQALVLALANDDSLKARTIYDFGMNKLTGQQKAVFITETRNWAGELGIENIPLPSDSDLKDQLRSIVEKGDSQPLKPASENRKEVFLKASATPLWDLWARWGLALGKNGSGNGTSGYISALEAVLAADSPLEKENAVIIAVSEPLMTKLDRETLLRWVLDKDIHHLSSGRTLTAMTPVPALAKKIKDDSLALHALLGVALLADDMRGIVGVATPMPQTGLTKQEKLCFLYPLPRSGSIHDALATSNSDAALLLAVARSESLFEPSVRSRAGALGWMQIMPFHFPHKGARPGADNWSCASVSIAKGDGLLTENRRRYKGNPYLTLAAYNAGPGAVARWQKQLGGSKRNDIFLAWIGYPETRHYVEKVLIDREIYDWIISESRFE